MQALTDLGRSIFFKPDPAEQQRKCTALIRKNTRALDKDIRTLQATESKTKSAIISASKLAERNPAQAKQKRLEARTYARELARMRKQTARLYTSKAQLQSVEMQVNEAFATRKLANSMRASTGVMKDVNTLVKMPELTATMNELGQELMKAGIIEDMVGDMIAGDEELGLEDEETEAEVDAVLGEVLKGRLATVDSALPTLPTTSEPEEEEAVDLDAMRGRLEALKS